MTAQKKKDTWSNILLILILVIGLSLLLYPSVAESWNARFRNRVIATYAEDVANLDDGRYDEIWNNAKAYNQSLVARFNQYKLEDEQKAQYDTLLNLSGNGLMGYIDIPSINCTLPIFHSTDEAVLQVAIGHLDWTSLPTGGESTHCVLSGHRGLPSAKLFTDLDKLMVGDQFTLNILNETLAYQVDQIKIVLPHESQDLMIVPGEDYVTLVTCTPYGVNSHRMLVRGTRIANLKDVKIKRVTADAILVEPVVVAPFVAAPMLLVLFIYLMIPKRKKKGRKPL